MTPITREWVEKAEGDYAVVRRELRVRKDPNYDGVCFHSQQCVEKYLKARLQEAVVAFPKTHDLVELLRLLRPLEPTWWTFWRKMRALTNYAVAVRYPGTFATRVQARRAFERCRELRKVARRALRLKP